MGSPTAPLGVSYRTAAVSARTFLLTTTRRHWSGTANLPKPGVGAVICPNHVSYLDPFVVGHFLYDNGLAPRFLAKASLFEAPLLGSVVRNAEQIPVYRGGPEAAESIGAAVEAVRAGECVLVYPEATLTKDPNLWPMRGKTGAARIAMEADCPVIPIGHWGVQEILPQYHKRPRLFPPTDVYVRAGAPLTFPLTGRQRVTPTRLRRATDAIMASITSVLEELRGGVAPTERFDPSKHGVPETGSTRA